MSNTEWSLAGKVGDISPEDVPPPFEPQVMTQGIGFPLRQVSGAPPEDSGQIFNPETVAAGVNMIYCQNWEQGKAYFPGYVTSDGTWVMIANTPTLENPIPKPDGSPTYGLPAYAPATQSNSSVVYSGHLYTFTQDVIIREIRVWVTQLTGDTNYRVIGVYNFTGGQPPRAFTLEEPVLTEDAWQTISLPQQLMPTGGSLFIYIDALNSGSDTPVTGGWSYQGQNNTGAPLAQQWNRNNGQTLVRIDKTDLDGTDRTSELAGMQTGTSIQFVDTDNPDAFFEYRVTADPTDEGTYFSYPVTLINEGLGGPSTGTTTMTALVPVNQPTEYAEEAGVPTPAWATVQGYLAYNGTEQPAGQTNSYGVDLQCEQATFSSDWDVLSFNTP